MNWLRIALFPILLASLTGCFQSDTAIFVRSDGSGRVEITNLMSAEMVEMMSFMTELEPTDGEGEDAPTDAAPPELFSEADARAAVADMGEGVTFKSIEPVEVEGFVGAKTIYEFTDITKLRVDAKPDALPADPEEGGPGEELVMFAFEQSDGTSRLRIRMPDEPSDPTDDADDSEEDGAEEMDMGNEGEESGPPAEAELEMLRGMLDGLKFGMRVVTLGELVETNSIHVDGNEVTLFEIDFGALVKDAEALAQLASQDEPESFAEISKVLQELPGIKINPVDEITIEFKK